MKTLYKLQTILFLCLALILCASLVRPIQAAPQGTIQDMIDAAEDGASLDIPAGTYSENLTIVNKNITLRGANRDTTIIQAANSNQTVIITNSDKGLRLENLTIRGGHPSSATGGGVYAAGGTLQIVNCRITDNSADYGGGVFLDVSGSNLVMSGVTVDNNTASVIGGGVYTAGSATLYNTTLDANTASIHGGGLNVAGSATLTGGTVSGNRALNGNGGGVNVNDGLAVSGTTFTNNTAAGHSDIAGSGGAISQWNYGQTVSISEAVFSGNSAQFRGGAAYIRQSSLTLDNSTFTNNMVDSGTTGDDVYGGGVYAGGPLQVDTATFTGNRALCDFCNFNVGGGLDSEIRTGTVTVTNSQFDSNEGWFGGGLSGYTTLAVTHSSFTNNQGGYGGGIDTTTLSGDWLLFQDNHAANLGGAISASDLTLAHSRFINNSAHKGGAIQVYDILRPSSNLLFVENSASYGAVVHADSDAVVTFYNATIARAAQAAGPAIDLEANVAVNLYNSIVTNYTNAITFRGSGTLNEDYNLFYNNGYDIVGGTCYPGGHSTGTLPPGFANPAAGNYHLKSTANAIGAGHNYGLADDLDGRPRLSGRNDAGAYQFWGKIYLPLTRK